MFGKKNQVSKNIKKVINFNKHYFYLNFIDLFLNFLEEKEIEKYHIHMESTYFVTSECVLYIYIYCVYACTYIYVCILQYVKCLKHLATVKSGESVGLKGKINIVLKLKGEENLIFFLNINHKMLFSS